LKIDLHAHFIPRDYLNITDREGHKYGPAIGKNASGEEVLMIGDRLAGPVLAQVCDPERRIRDMDGTGLDAQAISISPTNVFYNINDEDGLDSSQKYNDAIAEVVRAHPDRFVGIATVPMQNVSEAVQELERSVHELGLKAVEVLSNINGKNLDEPELWPFYQKAQDLDIPIFVHPHNVAGADRMRKYWLANLIGNPLDTSIAIASIIFGGVLESFPRLKFLFAHAGGFAPFIRGRWERGYRFVDECRSTPKPPSEYFELIYFDTVVHFGPALKYLIDTVGDDKVVLGSDSPYVMGDLDPVITLSNIAGISAASREKILEYNSVALLKLAV